MRTITDTIWVRRGMSLLWDSSALASVLNIEEAVTLRELFQMSKQWPEDLPSARGDAVGVVGLEAALDCLAPEDAEKWLENSIRPMLLDFQNHYDGQAGLHFWLPGGRSKIKPSFASNSFGWSYPPPRQCVIPLGRLLWSGAESESARILKPGTPSQDADGPDWQGIHQRRVS